MTVIQRELEDLGYDGYNGLVIREPLFDESIPYSKFMDNPKNIPTMIGCTRYEHDHESNLFPIGESMGFENFKEVEEKYQLDKKEGNYDFHNHSDETQAIMVQTIFRANKLLENNVTTYLYEYTYPKHARHTDDLFYIMGVHSFEMDENERLLAQVYVKMFANFAKFGEPRVPGFEETTRDTHQYFNVFWNETSGERPSMKEHFEQNIISYWFNDMITYDKNITAQKLKNSPKITLKSQEMTSKNCSVVFYLHGGALAYDSAVMFNDTVLFNSFVKQDVILVISAFRLGIFSHFMVEDQSIAPNNLAIYDFENHADETQAIFVQTRIRANKLIEHRVPTYLYEYTYPKHARHTDDLFYIMGVHSFEMDENERRLAQVYVKMFANFAKFGEPRVHGFDVTKRGSYFDVFWNETSGERPAMKEHFEQNASKNCSVVFYLHGGALAYDSSVMFNDTVLFNSFVKQDVILVIPAFRLGIFSHFVVEDQSIAPNNLALYDILLGLEFVKNEIANFGGSSQKVTVMGHSYGGQIAAFLTFSTEVNQDLSLFQKTISMSSEHHFDTLEAQIERTQRFAEFANCLPPSTAKTVPKSQKIRDLYMMNCLQGKSANELLRIQRQLEDLGYEQYKYLIQRAPFFQNGSIFEFLNSPNQIPHMTGCTRYEYDHEPADRHLENLINFENPKQVEEKYRLDKSEGNYNFQNHSDDTQAIFIQTLQRVNKLTENGVPAYLYEYTYPKHAKHTDDLFYIMGVHSFEMDENERRLAQVYVKMFANFAKFGEPRVHGFDVAKRGSYFDVFWNETSGEKPAMKEHFEQNIISYWFNDMIAYDKNITAFKKAPSISKNPRLLHYQSNGSNLMLYEFFFIFIFLIFLAGCLVGKCFATEKRNLYIQLDGDEF
uniref:Carboxylesterase type B domain-containing protein n=1 Tax=Caenorhabditis japonica TaxID=281687 RepID=A0A8R1HH27_CAEJA